MDAFDHRRGGGGVAEWQRVRMKMGEEEEEKLSGVCAELH